MKTTVVNMRDCPDGWEKDPSYVYVGRPGQGLSGTWGNNHPIGRPCPTCKGREHNRTESIERFAQETRQFLANFPGFRTDLEQLRGKFLVCFCKQAKFEVPCHADVYVELLGDK